MRVGAVLAFLALLAIVVWSRSPPPVTDRATVTPVLRVEPISVSARVREAPATPGEVAVLERAGPAAIPALRAAVLHGSEEVRDEAAQALADLGPAGAGTLIDLSRAAEPEVREIALDALFWLVDDEPGEPVVARVIAAGLRCLRDAESCVVESAIALLALAPDAIPGLEHRIAGGPVRERVLLLRVLREADEISASALLALRRVACDARQPDPVHWTAAHVLAARSSEEPDEPWVARCWWQVLQLDGEDSVDPCTVLDASASRLFLDVVREAIDPGLVSDAIVGLCALPEPPVVALTDLARGARTAAGRIAALRVLEIATHRNRLRGAESMALQRAHELLRDPLPELREQAGDLAIALYRAGTRPGSPLLELLWGDEPARTEAVRVARALGDEAAIAADALREIAVDPALPAAGRAEAVDALSVVAGPVTRPLLIELACDREGAVREESVRALRRIGEGDQATAEALLARLDDPDPKVRARAVMGGRAFRARAETAVTRLIGLREDENLRPLAAHSLARLGKPARRAGPKLEECLPLTGGDARWTIIWALAALGWECDPKSAPILLEAHRHRRSRYDAAALRCLSRIRPGPSPIVPELIAEARALSGDDRELLVSAIGRLGSTCPEAVPMLVAELEADDYFCSCTIYYNIPVAAAEALGYLGRAAAPAVPALVKALHHGNPSIREAAAEALQRIPASPRER